MNRQCDFPGCAEKGEYRAPRSPLHVEQRAQTPEDRYLHFCLAHVREYNKKWDYFAQMSLAEIEAFQREAIVGHRKTKPIGAPHWRSPFLHKQDAWFFGFKLEEGAPPAAAPTAERLSKKQRAALAVFDLTYPFTPAQLKTRYRALVKKTHPDTNGGDKQAEARFREITEAYGVLKQI